MDLGKQDLNIFQIHLKISLLFVPITSCGKLHQRESIFEPPIIRRCLNTFLESSETIKPIYLPTEL